MKIATLTAAAALAALHMSAPAHAQLTDTLQKIKSSGVIQLGGRDGSFPFSYKTSADSAPVGFSADLCMKVVDAVKAKLQMPDLKVQYTIVTPLNRIPLVQNGTIDLECSTTTNTAARAQLVQFAPTHFVGSIAVAVKSNSGINSLAELDGKAIATVSGSTSIQVMRAYRRNEKVEFSEVSGKDNSETFLMLSSGRAVAMILEDVQLAGLIARAGQPSDYKILSERLRDEPYGFMYRKDDPQFAALVDSTLTQVMKSGEIDKLYARWFTQPIAPTNVNLNFPMTDGVREAFRNPNKKPAL